MGDIPPQIDGLVFPLAMRMLGDDRPLFRHLLEIYLEQFAGVPAQLAALGRAADPAALNTLLHKIKGASAAIGLEGPRLYALELEMLLLVGAPADGPSVQQAVETLAVQLERSMNDARRWLLARPAH